MFSIQRLTRGRWKETARLDHNHTDRLARLPDPHRRRVVDLTTGTVWTWGGPTVGYRETKPIAKEESRG